MTTKVIHATPRAAAAHHAATAFSPPREVVRWISPQQFYVSGDPKPWTVMAFGKDGWKVLRR